MNPIEYAKEEFKPVKLYAFFSGGNDSLCSTHFAMQHGADEVIHINTGIGIEQTREFVRGTCKMYGWPLRELYPPDKTYRDLVLKNGFPGPAAHRYMYQYLKERAIRKLVRETKTKRGDRVGLITGVRCQESARRMGYTVPVIRIDATVWIAPIYNYSKIDTDDYIKAHGLNQNLVSRWIGFSGECLCGAFAQPGELKKIETYFPKDAAKIYRLQEEVKEKGKHCVWGTRPPKARELNQYDIPFMPLCSGCPVSQI